jgi:hypothetical protein
MKTPMSVAVAVSFGLCLLTPSSAAAVILLGETVEVTYHFPDLATDFAGPTDVIVGAGTELFNFAGYADIDLSDTNILITTTRAAAINGTAFDGLHFFDVFGTIPALTTVLINPATSYPGLDASRITFDADNIYINLVDLPALQGDFISIDLVAGSSAVPEPGTLGLLGAGLATLLSRRRLKS